MLLVPRSTTLVFITWLTFIQIFGEKLTGTGHQQKGFGPERAAPRRRARPCATRRWPRAAGPGVRATHSEAAPAPRRSIPMPQVPRAPRPEDAPRPAPPYARTRHGSAVRRWRRHRTRAPRAAVARPASPPSPPRHPRAGRAAYLSPLSLPARHPEPPRAIAAAARCWSSPPVLAVDQPRW
jgi:hypothetical protein